ncbi:hypothetical protein NL676_025280 [Syzygium grande]|nr:hypothetical protein NL676_025280 [Syzygium grande]
MEVEVASKEFIKPSRPTPNHLKIHKLSLLDQFLRSLYIPLVLFYTVNEAEEAIRKAKHILPLLKQSLSETLALFYPLAGKINDGLSIECDDEGALFVEARADFPLLLLLHQPDLETIAKLLPCPAAWTEAKAGDRVVMVQATAFACGGVAVSVLISHAAADCASFSTFLKGWAAMACKSGGAPSPNFEASSRFIPSKGLAEEDSMSAIYLPFLKTSRCGTRRFIFDSSAMARLKAKATNSQVQNPTRVEVVTALMRKSVVAALNKVSNLEKPVGVILPLNIRRRAVPSFPDDSMGNYVWVMTVLCSPEEKDNSLPDLISHYREIKDKVDGPFVKGFVGDGGLVMLRNAIREIGESFTSVQDQVTITSWCNFGHYEIDFGWGTPAWVSMVGLTEEIQNRPMNFVTLLDTKSRKGVEAWVFMGEQELHVLEQNEELLEFASVNPSTLEI